MLDCISVDNMRLSDAWTMERLVSGQDLMYRAAYGVFQAVNWHGRTAIAVGSGNNGGDGFALACILKAHNLACTVFTLSQRFSPDSAHYAALAETSGVPIRPFADGCLDGYDIIVDCLLGTGFQGVLRENYSRAITQINASKAYVISVDINSGMNGDTGEAQLAVYSDLTVTIGYVKNGLITHNAGDHIKKLVCVDIGIELVREENKLCDDQEWLALCQSYNIYPKEQSMQIREKTYFLSPSWLDWNIIRIYG